MQDKIIVRGAREHNLKNINVEMHRNKLVCITGVSGSVKSSLAFDTIFAEGQRRYVESLSAYARQFLGQMEKPDVDDIEGLSPAISIDQKAHSSNPRSTVATITEIYDYLRVLYARVGKPHSRVCASTEKNIDSMRRLNLRAINSTPSRLWSTRYRWWSYSRPHLRVRPLPPRPLPRRERGLGRKRVSVWRRHSKRLSKKGMMLRRLCIQINPNKCFRQSFRVRMMGFRFQKSNRASSRSTHLMVPVRHVPDSERSNCFRKNCVRHVTARVCDRKRFMFGCRGWGRAERL